MERNINTINSNDKYYAQSGIASFVRADIISEAFLKNVKYYFDNNPKLQGTVKCINIPFVSATQTIEGLTDQTYNAYIANIQDNTGQTPIDLNQNGVFITCIDKNDNIILDRVPHSIFYNQYNRFNPIASTFPNSLGYYSNRRHYMKLLNLKNIVWSKSFIEVFTDYPIVLVNGTPRKYCFPILIGL